VAEPQPSRVIEVFADVGCPFTHVGLLRFVERRRELARDDVGLRVRSWPLEVVNGAPLDPVFIAEEIDEIRRQVAPDLFSGFTPDAFPASTMPPMGLAAAAYTVDVPTGEAVSLELRRLLFEEGVDVGRPDVLSEVGARFGVDWDGGLDAVLADHAEGVARGVIGSPHFFAAGEGFFCPALDVSRDAEGHLRITADPTGFAAFLDACLAG
jgi:2-hydroxychromene-2-carboxylate isomerase